MAMRFLESFDHYTTNAAFAVKWSEFNGAPAPVAGGRFENHMSVTANTFWRKVLDAQATWIVGMAFIINDDAISGSDPLISFYDDTTKQVFLELDGATRKLRVKRGDGTILGTGTTILSQQVYHYIEFKATIHNSTGVAVVRINEVTELNLTSQDTQNTANATANKIGFFGDGASGDTLAMDDLYILDGTGSSPNNDFIGDVRIEYIEPNGNGNSSQLVGSDGNSTDNYLLVDEATPNSDTDYVESSTVGDKDTYAYANVTPTTGQVFGLQIIPFARKTDAGVRTIATVARHSGSEVDGPNQTLSTTYQYHHDIRETKPGGGTWSISDVNGAEFGVKVTA